MPQFIIRFLRLSFAVVAATGSAHAAVSLYDPTPGATTSQAIAVTADGISVPVVSFGDIVYARFVLTGSAHIQIATHDHAVEKIAVSPLARRIVPEIREGCAWLLLEAPGAFFISIEGNPALLLFADPPESTHPRLGDQGVLNLADFLPPRRDDPRAPITAFIQRAIDATSALDSGRGGVLYMPAGTYVSAQLKLKRNVHLYLESGALLQSQADFNPTDFPPQANNDSSFIFIEDASNVRLSGRGVIDGNGYAVRTRNARANIKLLRTAGAADVVVEDIFFRDSARWSLHLLDSDHVVLRNFKLVNDLRGGFDAKEKVHIAVVTNTDGVDVDGSRDVLVEDSFIYTADDALTPKVTNYMGRQAPCRDVVFRRNVLWTLKCALRVGDEAMLAISRVRFEDNDIIRADRVVALWNSDGGPMSDIDVVNNRTEYVGGDYNECFFTCRIWVRVPGFSLPGSITGLHVRDFFAQSPARQPSLLSGLDANHRVMDVSFENVVVAGRPIRAAADLPLTVAKFADAPVISAPAAR